MKKLTKSEFLEMPIGELGFKVRQNTMLTHKEAFNDIVMLEDLGVELLPDLPEITVENLGRFMAKYGGRPSAIFREGNQTYAGLLTYRQTDNYVSENFKVWPKCEIVDQRWSDLGGAE
jgi:hypothetical protein